VSVGYVVGADGGRSEFHDDADLKINILLIVISRCRKKATGSAVFRRDSQQRTFSYRRRAVEGNR
jgi:hypothetical protein